MIGDDVGIGADSLIWTHGAWLNVLDGFPATFKSVSIGSHVWLPARSIVLPGCSIGDNCVIGTGSIITKDIPSGSFAVGSPCKVIKENAYPINLSDEQKQSIVQDIVTCWFETIVPHKGMVNVQTTVTYPIVYLEHGNVTMMFDCNKMIHSELDAVGEDLRDYMRRRGIKFFTGKPFTSLPPLYETLLNEQIR